MLVLTHHIPLKPNPGYRYSNEIYKTVAVTKCPPPADSDGYGGSTPTERMKDKRTAFMRWHEKYGSLHFM